MAQRPSSRASGSRGGSRAGSRSPPRGGSRGASRGGSRGGRAAPRRGGGSNNTAIVISILLVVGVIAVFAIMSGDKKKKRVEEDPSFYPTSETVVEKGPSGPAEPERAPPPKISPEIIDVAKEIIVWMETEVEQGNRHYDDAMAAKTKGDEDTWQSKLEEAREHFQNINERWNEEIIAEIDGELPPGCAWDAEEVANHWIGRESGKVSKAVKRLGYINKQMRLH